MSGLTFTPTATSLAMLRKNKGEKKDRFISVKCHNSTAELAPKLTGFVYELLFLYSSRNETHGLCNLALLCLIILNITV